MGSQETLGRFYEDWELKGATSFSSDTDWDSHSQRTSQGLLPRISIRKLDVMERLQKGAEGWGAPDDSPTASLRPTHLLP